MRALRGRAGRLALRSFLAVSIVAVAACDGDGGDLTGPIGERPPPGGFIGGGSSTRQDASLIGEWTRRLVVMDNSGGISESATTWIFAAGGEGQRIQVSRNYTVGLVDSLFTSIGWSTNGGRITIEFRPPSSGEVSFRYSVLADTLSLDELRFVRQ